MPGLAFLGRGIGIPRPVPNELLGVSGYRGRHLPSQGTPRGNGEHPAGSERLPHQQLRLGERHEMTIQSVFRISGGGGLSALPELHLHAAARRPGTGPGAGSLWCGRTPATCSALRYRSGEWPGLSDLTRPPRFQKGSKKGAKREQTSREPANDSLSASYSARISGSRRWVKLCGYRTGQWRSG
jgi:hypothetical protein